MNLEYTETPKNEDIHFLTHQINQENLEFGDAYSFSFFEKEIMLYKK